MYTSGFTWKKNIAHTQRWSKSVNQLALPYNCGDTDCTYFYTYKRIDTHFLFLIIINYDTTITIGFIQKLNAPKKGYSEYIEDDNAYEAKLLTIYCTH